MRQHTAQRAGTMITVIIPALLRPLCSGENVIQVEGATLDETLRGVDALCPGFYARIVQEGRVRPELALALNGEIISLPLQAPLTAGAEITLVPAIGGG